MSFFFNTKNVGREAKTFSRQQFSFLYIWDMKCLSQRSLGTATISFVFSHLYYFSIISEKSVTCDLDRLRRVYTDLEAVDDENSSNVILNATCYFGYTLVTDTIYCYDNIWQAAAGTRGLSSCFNVLG